MSLMPAITMSGPSPPRCPDVTVTFPTEHILLATLNRPSKMNSITKAAHWHLDSLWNWYDENPKLRVAIITGAGTKAFCAGSDLLEIERNEQRKMKGEYEASGEHPASGFAGVSRRKGKKPIIAAVNGLALGGGFEIVLNW